MIKPNATWLGEGLGIKLSWDVLAKIKSDYKLIKVIERR